MPLMHVIIHPLVSLSRTILATVWTPRTMLQACENELMGYDVYDYRYRVRYDPVQVVVGEL
jgi:hypothetical protein